MKSTLLRAASAFAVTAFVCASAGSVANAADRETGTMEDWIQQKAEYFEANPELKSTKGSGWKPYNRAKWFYEQRVLNGVGPVSGQRWAAWERKQEILDSNPGLHRGSGSPTWFSLGPENFAGRTLDIEFEPGDNNTVYMGSASGGLWRTENGGASWVPLTDEIPSLAIGAIAVLPWDTNTILIGTGEGANGDVDGVGILKSTDYGVTWNPTSLVYAASSNNGFHVMELNETTQTILAGDKAGLWRSTDSGDTWTAALSNGDFYDVAWKPGSTTTVYTVKGSASGGNNVKISTDDGLTWAKAGTGQPASFNIGKSKIAVTAANPEYIYALYSDGPGNMTGLYRSTDGGSTWTARNTSTNIPGGQGWYNLSLVADPNNAERIIAGGVNLFRSTNGGTSFTGNGAGVHVDHHAAKYEPGSNSNVWVGSDGGVWRSTNDGTNWTDMNNGTVTYQFYDICVNNGPTPYFILGGTQDNGTDRWGGTTTWSSGLGGDGMVCHVNPVNGNVVYAESQFGGMAKNNNQGLSGPWTGITGGFTGVKAWVTPWDEDQLVGNHLMAGSSQGIFETTNGGSAWTNIAPHTATWIDFSQFSSDVTWTVGATAHVTTDNGDSWTQCASYGFSTGGATKILAHPTDLASAFVTFSSYGPVAHVAYTTDYGASWADVTGDFPSQPVNAIAVDPEFPDDWYIGTDVGIWKSSNGGANWLPWDTALPNVVVSDLEIQREQRKLVAGTYGRGAWEMDLPATTTDVNVGESALSNLMLDRPFPNPIRDRTILRWAAAVEGPSSLTIYDVSGRRLVTLDEVTYSTGVVRHTPWLTDDVPSGVYFAVVEGGGERMSRKMVVAK